MRGRRLAVHFPDLSIGGLYIAGESGGVHQEGVFHSFGQLLNQFFPAVVIGGERGGDLDVLFFGAGDEIGELEVGEEADTAAADGGWGGEGDEGGSHPEGVAACGAAGIREGIEGDVDPGVHVQVFGKGEETDKADPIGRDILGFEYLLDALAAAPSGACRRRLE